MQKLMIATIGLSLSMGVAAAAVAQPASAPGQTPPATGTSGDTLATMPSTSPMQGNPPTGNTTAAPGTPSAGAAAPDSSSTMSSGGNAGNMTPPPPPRTYPRCSATVHDECRQRQ